MRPRSYAGIAALRLGGLALCAALLIVSSASVASASSAAISVDKRCYVFTKAQPATMVIKGAGFVPGEKVVLSSSLGWQNTQSVTADPTGAFTAAFHAPEPNLELPGRKTVTLTAEDFNAGLTISATTPATVARFGVAATPVGVPVTRKVTWYLAGFEPSKQIYVHYLHTKPVATMRLGRADGPCGVLQARARLYPGGHPRYRKYTVQIDDARIYAKQATPRIVTSLTFSTH